MRNRPHSLLSLKNECFTIRPELLYSDCLLYCSDSPQEQHTRGVLRGGFGGHNLRHPLPGLFLHCSQILPHLRQQAEEPAQVTHPDHCYAHIVTLQTQTWLRRTHCVCICRVSSNICYRKQPWSLVKALIEKNTWSGIEEYYRHMGKELFGKPLVSHYY